MFMHRDHTHKYHMVDVKSVFEKLPDGLFERIDYAYLMCVIPGCTVVQKVKAEDKTKEAARG